ncbi:MAG: alanine racemase [Gammaproteobacteria bacterium]
MRGCELPHNHHHALTSETNASGTSIMRIDLDALARNYRALRKAAAPGRCGAVVKANAYGLGVEPVAKRLFDEGCRQFFVANLSEGIALRELFATAEIFVFSGALDGEERALRAASLIPVLNSHEQVVRWVELSDSKRYPAVINIDTGMSRLGLDARELNQLALDAGTLEEIEISYVMTHLACGDTPENPMNHRQIEEFEALKQRLPPSRTSIGNSAGLLSGEMYQSDLSRPGIALYGGNPFSSKPNPMEPVVTLLAPILQVREVTRTTTVGYGATRQLNAPARLATLGVGYADGIPYSLSNLGRGYLSDTYVPIVGRVSMDFVSVDVSAVPRHSVYPGAMVELAGANVLLDDVAKAAGTIGYEILTGLGPRWERSYLTS